jgi:hypothetical protein
VSRLALAAAVVLAFATAASPAAAKLLVPMDLTQTDHLKAYGLIYWCLERGQNAEWLLNYRGGSFFIEDRPENRTEAGFRGVLYEEAGGSEISSIYKEIEEDNMEVVLLETAPRVAVYAPPDVENEPWDDAVALALDYADIPYTRLYDSEVLEGRLEDFDWLHLHHEDFTGQYGKFFAAYRNAEWYLNQQRASEATARALGFRKAQDLKKAVARAIKEYIGKGGFVFAMCSATDSYDIALAAEGVDIVPREYDGDPASPDAQRLLDFSKCLVFTSFALEMNPFVYEFSNIDTSNYSVLRGAEADYFTLFDFSAKADPVPTMLVQDHVSVVNGFMGQTTGFARKLLRSSVTVLGEVEGTEEVKYVHANYGKGTITFLGGHDPEDYQHAVGDPPTNLALHKNSPGYRLVLNNILFPAAQKKERKT